MFSTLVLKKSYENYLVKFVWGKRTLTFTVNTIQ